MFPFAQQAVRRGASLMVSATLLFTMAGPTAAGPTAAGPTAAGPTAAGPTAAGPTAAQVPMAADAAQAATAPPSWDKLKAAYAYQPAVADPDYLIQRVALLDAEGKNIPGLFLRPKPRGVYPVVLLLHGLGSDKELMIRVFGRPLAARGFACLALDARDHGERKPTGAMWDIGALLTPNTGRKPAPAPAPGATISESAVRFGAVLKGTVGDYRRALDYLQTRDDVDSRRVGLLGYSMGAMMGAILAGVDERINATVLEVGGDPIRPLISGVPEPLRDLTEAISPSNYIGHIAPRPVLLINAKADQIMSADAAKRLQEAAREPKQIVWAEGGHILAEADAMQGVAWLAEKLDLTR